MNKVENLTYDYDALEPHIDEETMKIHHDRHFQAYFDNFIKTIEGTELEGKDVKKILGDLENIPDKIKQTVINNGGGYFNHKFFWTILKKDVPFEGEIEKAILEKWGSFEKFKEEFSNAAKTQFGSGWAWLVLSGEGLKIIKTSNFGRPLWWI